MTKQLFLLLSPPLFVILVGSLLVGEPQDNGLMMKQAQTNPHNLFETATACVSCHNQLVTPSGEDISFGSDWRASMMANSARDPYWQAAVRREVTDHPESQAHIEEECSTCHMPMAHYQTRVNGGHPAVFPHLPASGAVSPQDKLAVDGVSCTTCHQITADKLGTRESFVGGFVIDTLQPMGSRKVYGPYPVDPGRSTIMHSSSGFIQTQSTHIQQSEFCASCHTLITNSLGPDGEVIGKLPEQVPFLEWKHSRYRTDQSCQTCHMPVVEEPAPIASVMAQPRSNVSRHSFRGGNFFMISMLNRYRNDLGVVATPGEMGSAIDRTINHLQTKSARLEVQNISVDQNELRAEVVIDNLAGHKLPTAYPSRRVWIHFTITDRQGQVVFESGSIRPDGSISGNDNDSDPARYEPHYNEITSSEQVQIYESIMADPQGQTTTGLLTAVRFIKDNRILPDGFDKATAADEIAVRGSAYEDPDFRGGSDRIRYRVNLPGNSSSYTVTAELVYQPIAYRWAHNLSDYNSMETNRFVGYYDSMSEHSWVTLATAKARVDQE